jgi:hypothetical protein
MVVAANPPNDGAGAAGALGLAPVELPDVLLPVVPVVVLLFWALSI